jgi:hypothetical protein
MNEKQADKSPAAPAAATPPGPETQKQRWVKYGANVALASVVVILLAVIFTALAQQSWAKLHVDTTQAGLYSLKPQTKAILRDLKQDVRIVSLYTQTKPRPGQEREHTDFATPVADLLGEYERYGGGRVTTEVIDPTQNPAKVDALIEDVATRYGGEIKQYRDFLDGFTPRNEAFQKLLAAETAAISDVDAAAAAESEAGQWVNAAREQLRVSADALKKVDARIKRLLEQKPPNYKGAVTQVRQVMEEVSQFAAAIQQRFEETKEDAAAPPPVKAYAAESPARYAEIKKQADAFVAEVGKLGELKLDDLRQTLQAPDGIVVLGPKDMRVLSFEQIWRSDPDVRRMVAQAAEGAEIKPQFAGEQQITSAVLALTQEKKPKVAFVRGGGPPVAKGGNPFARGGAPLSQVAARLEEYNFEVLEKDLSGMWAMQARMQQMPAGPEPDDAAIADAVWVVIASRSAGGGPMGPPPSIAPRVAEHLKAGGSAMILMPPEGEDMSDALTEWGIRTRSDAIIVHQPVPAGDGPPGDMINEAQKNPFVFITSEYGQHLLAPRAALDMPLIAAVPVGITPVQGVTQWSLLPVPNDPPAWGETALQGVADREVALDKGVDVEGPLFAGAAAEKGAGRVVVLGTYQSFINDILSYPDMELLQRGFLTTRFPGSGEVFNNSIFWLAKMEPMIAISPAAMDVSRIEKMGPGATTFWRNFVPLAGLPLLVVVAGGLMYMRRRD